MDYDAAPSHDTFSRLLRLLDPEAFGRAFAAFAVAFVRAGQETPEVVSLDGKALRRAYEKGLAASPPLTVSGFAAETRLCLAAVSPSDGENEVEAALKVIEPIDLTGRLITADALHCHPRMAEAITQRGGDYLLALKGNRRHWLRRANLRLADATPSIAERTETSHGRNEWRQAEIVAAAEPLMPGHQAFIRITSRRDQAKPLMRLFMASTLLSPQQALDLTRAHWQIENGLHWMLDVHLDEDLSRAARTMLPPTQPSSIGSPETSCKPPTLPTFPSATALRNAPGMTTTSSMPSLIRMTSTSALSAHVLNSPGTDDHVAKSDA
ncbi:ISAs1 family transposase [Mesorhizobium sp. M0047]|uniref:ISAs1 family transposase n=1 Tax=Mesorhizobium sp. M0047 TaxID=2956859 RepID=UPI00333DB786